MKKYDLNFTISVLQKISPRFDDHLQGEHELYADCGLDSREFVHVIRELESVLKQEIDDEDLLEAQLITINDLINFINKINDKQTLNLIHENK